MVNGEQGVVSGRPHEKEREELCKGDETRRMMLMWMERWRGEKTDCSSEIRSTPETAAKGPPGGIELCPGIDWPSRTTAKLLWGLDQCESAG